MSTLRQKLDSNEKGADRILMYHSRMRLGEFRMAPITGGVDEVLHLLTMLEQRRNTVEMANTMRINGAPVGSVVDRFAPEAEQLKEHAVVQLIRDIPGVEMVAALGYCVIVIRAQAFTWSEIEPLIARAFSTFNLELPDPEQSVPGVREKGKDGK